MPMKMLTGKGSAEMLIVAFDCGVGVFFLHIMSLLALQSMLFTTETFLDVICFLHCIIRTAVVTFCMMWQC